LRGAGAEAPAGKRDRIFREPTGFQTTETILRGESAEAGSKEREDKTMRRVQFWKMLACLGVFALLGGVTQADLIGFDFDASGDKPNGWTSTDSAICHFTDSIGSGLDLQNWGNQSHGQGLAVFGDDASVLIIDFDVLVKDISLDFGNDDTPWASPGDVALLTLFSGGGQVGQTSVLLNLNDLMDQSISIFGISFDQAQFVYADATFNPIGLIEIVDDISFTRGDGDIPEPATLLLIGAGIAGLGIRRRLLG